MTIDDLKNLYVTRERDLYTFGILDENNRVVKKVQYQFGDECYAIGVSGKRLKACTRPSFLPTPIADVMWNCVRYNETAYLNREYFDRLISLPVDIRLKFVLLTALAYSIGAGRNEEQNGLKWSNLMALLKKYGEEKILLACSTRLYALKDVEQNLLSVEYFEKYNMTEMEDTLRIDRNFDIQFLKEKAFREAVKHAWKNPYEEPQNKVRELFPTLTDEEIRTYLGISFHDYNRNNAVWTVTRNMRDIKMMLAEMEDTTYKLTNIQRDLETIRGLYEKSKRERENKKFKEYQTKYDLHFEDDLYRVIVPTTREDLDKIGRVFHNCANAYEWNTRLYDGEYHLVVVEDKASGEWKVCVDIRDSNMTIGQYLGEHNNRITDEYLRDTFYDKYRNYLKSLKRAK